MKKTSVCVVGLLGLFLGSSALATSLKAFPYVKDLREVSCEGRGLGWFELDAEVLRVAALDFSNMRMADTSGQQVPFSVCVDHERKRTYDCDSLSITQDGRDTVLTFKAVGLPVNSLMIHTSDENFSRRLIVEGARDDQVGYLRLAIATIAVVRVGAIEKDSTQIRLSKTVRYAKYRIRIENEDNPPLSVDGISLDGPVAKVQFFNDKGGREFRLFYGGHARLPSYDLNEVLRSGKGVTGDEYALDWQVDNPDYSALSAAGGRGGRYTLVVAMVLAMLALGWLVLLSIKRVDRLQPGNK